MAKALIAFLIFFIAFYAGIDGFRRLSNKDKWSLTKISLYAILCSVLAVGFLTLIVILF
jgi:hypothetical protein